MSELWSWGKPQYEIEREKQLAQFEAPITTIDEVGYVNTTPHSINLQTPTGKNYVVPPCGYVLNGVAKELTVGEHNGITYVTTEFLGNSEGRLWLSLLREKYPETIILGSMIAA